MPKGPRLPDDMRKVFLQLLVDHADWTAKQMRNHFREQFEQRYPARARAHPGFPAVNTVEKWRAADKRTRLSSGGAAPKPEDQPWTFLSLYQYPLPPDTLPAILRLWLFAKGRLTIREVRWAAQLSHLVSSPLELLRACAEMASQERISELYPWTRATSHSDAAYLEAEHQWLADLFEKMADSECGSENEAKNL